ncbi:YCF48-related protein [Arundinibacter roseus]|uniref:T9SS type A sorting domain-containing protein n=1 Tax=Arundinibacter roseus TaxID=2070510 RepID=A0A4R4KBB0_9BACT|nr:YCF48-related protein [Arundinibacter roseus]TDB63751.1 T9SS type A sorting domain-containing protein [Arundinibacter roseus]
MKVYLHTLLTISLFAVVTLPSFAQVDPNCKPSVEVGKNSFCEDDTTQLRVEPTPNTTYRWIQDTSFIAGANTNTLVVNKSGTYRLETVRKEEAWTWGMAGGPDSDLNDIQFLGNTGWIVGNYGLLLKTTDGLSWDTIRTNRQDHLTALSFVNTQIGWIGGASGLLLKSTNGGTTWAKVNIPVSGTIQEIKFLNENTGFVLADRRLFKTINGGIAWSELILPDPNLTNFTFVNANVGWIALGNQLYKTDNGGTSWQLNYTAESSCTQGVQRIFALNTATCWVEFITCSQVTNFPTQVARTLDGGQTWSKHSIRIPATFPALSTFNVSDLFFTDSQTGYAVGQLYKRVFAQYGVSGGGIFQTKDGGQTWLLIYENVSNGYPRSIAFSSSSQGYVVGSGGLMLRVADSDSISTPFPERTFLPLHTVGGTPQRVFAAGGTPRRTESGVHPDSKAVTLTMEAGMPWVKNETQVNIPGGNFLISNGYTVRQIKFKNNQFGWRVGFGVLATTTNGGETWQTLFGNTQPPTFVIDKAYFQTVNSGFYISRDPAFGGASLYRFSGASRTPVPISYIDTPDNNTGMLDLQFINDNVGFITTSNGKLIKTIDGGNSWSVQLVRAGKSLQRCFFVNDRIGWVISNDGVILKTQNGGQSWTQQTSGVSTSLNGIYFLSEQVGYIVGVEGLILKTNDGGSSWIRQTTDTRNTLNDVSFTDANTGWIVGEKGTVLKLTVNECRSISDPVVIKVNPKPQATITADGPTIICEGLSLMLFAPRGNGYTYQWFRNNAPVATGIQFAATQSGTYSVVVRNAEGCENQSNSITVTASPRPILSLVPPKDNTLCEGKSLEISVQSNVPNVSYEWFRNGVSIGNANAANVVTAESGTYQVKATTQAGCTSFSDTVVILPAYKINLLAEGSTTICEGQTVDLKVQSTSSASITNYQWFRDGTAISGATTDTFAANQGGNYSLETVDSKGCKTISEPLPIEVTSRPAQPVITAGNSITLVSSAERGNQWFLNTNAISGATGNEYDPAESGSYTVQVTENGCQSPMSVAYVFTITSLDELPGLATVNVFPNPTQAEVYVSLKDLSGPVAIEILSLSGQQLRVQYIASTAQRSNIPLDVKGLASGTYLVKVRAGTFSKVSKVVLNR